MRVCHLRRRLTQSLRAALAMLRAAHKSPDWMASCACGRCDGPAYLGLLSYSFVGVLIALRLLIKNQSRDYVSTHGGQ